MYAFTAPKRREKGVVPAVLETQEDLQVAQVRHWEVRKAKRAEIEQHHKAKLEEELNECERKHPGAKERIRECQEKREAIKKHEVQLMQHRHDESFHGMQIGGHLKAQSYWEKQRAQLLKDTQEDEKMEKLRDQLRAAGRM